MWNNTLNSRRKAFWQYYLSKQIPDVYKKPLEKNPPQFPRKFLPRMIENETKEETEIRTRLSAEKFKWGIHLEDLRSEQYEIRLNNVDANMITYFTANYEDDICDNITELWERDWKRYFMERRNGTWTTFLQVSAKLHKVWDKKRNLKISETPKMIGKVETDTIKRERRKTLSMIAVIKVEVTTNITHINPQQTNLLKMIKTNDLY